MESINIKKHFIIIIFILMSKSLHAHDPNVAYAVFTIIGIVFLLIVTSSLMLSLLITFIYKRFFQKVHGEGDATKSLFKSSFICAILFGLLGFMVDSKLMADAEFYGTSLFMFFWIIGVFIGASFGLFITHLQKKNPNQ